MRPYGIWLPTEVTGSSDHASEEMIQLYALSRLVPTSVVTAVEEHALVCQSCQRDLLMEDEFLRGVIASIENRAKDNKPLLALSRALKGALYGWLASRADGE
jgi:hypothetical protein